MNTQTQNAKERQAKLSKETKMHPSTFDQEIQEKTIPAKAKEGGRCAKTGKKQDRRVLNVFIEGL